MMILRIIVTAALVALVLAGAWCAIRHTDDIAGELHELRDEPPAWKPNPEQTPQAIERPHSPQLHLCGSHWDVAGTEHWCGKPHGHSFAGDDRDHACMFCTVTWAAGPPLETGDVRD